MSGLRFLHLTDCHLSGQQTVQNKQSFHNINTFENLSRIIEDINKRERRKEIEYGFLLVTGDISQDGSKESYALFNSLIKTLNKPVYCLPGNHDDPALLKKTFKSSPDKAISVNLVQSHLLVLLNSHSTGHEYGEIPENQLKQLNNILMNNHNRPVIIALHHQPVNIKSVWMDNIGLYNRHELLTLLEKFPMVKMMLFGHVHQEVDVKHHQIKIMGTPSTCYQFKPQHETMLTDDISAGYRSIKLSKDGTIKTQVFRI